MILLFNSLGIVVNSIYKLIVLPASLAITVIFFLIPFSLLSTGVKVPVTFFHLHTKVTVLPDHLNTNINIRCTIPSIISISTTNHHYN